MKMSIDEFRKKFPHLAREILDEEGIGLTISVDSKKMIPDPWRGYTPGPRDYIRRCKSVEEALEVIDYLEKHGEITKEEADEYRSILKKHGLEYFGNKKGDDYYYKKAYEFWRKQKYVK